MALFAARTDALAGRPSYPLRSAIRVASGRGRDPLDQLRDFGPDVVHVHNLFPNFGRRWVEELDVPLVHTLHNYRPMCANGMLLRDGEICTLCPDGRRWSGVRYACYRGSRLATAPIAWANRHGVAADPLLSRADRLVLLSERQRTLYADAGLPVDQTVVWPNFLPDELDPGTAADGPSRDWLFVGRLSEEKGILELAARWPPGHRLRIVGDGPLRSQVAAAAGPDVEVLGALGRPEVIGLMRSSTGLVFPSLWYEPSATPLVYVEALAAGLPTLALPPSPVVESVRDDGSGTVTSWDELGDALRVAERHFPGLRGHCRTVFEERHTQAQHAERAARTYRRVIGERTAT